MLSIGKQLLEAYWLTDTVAPGYLHCPGRRPRSYVFRNTNWQHYLEGQSGIPLCQLTRNQSWLLSTIICVTLGRGTVALPTFKRAAHGFVTDMRQVAVAEKASMAIWGVVVLATTGFHIKILSTFCGNSSEV